METILGQSDKGCERQLHSWLDEAGRIAFWIQSTHKPKPNDASCIHVGVDELLQMLNRLMGNTGQASKHLGRRSR